MTGMALDLARQLDRFIEEFEKAKRRGFAELSEKISPIYFGQFERAAPHSITSSARASSIGGISTAIGHVWTAPD